MITQTAEPDREAHHAQARDWDAIDTVFLDMDGTLLDLHFDNHFWLEHVPKRYAEAQGIALDKAREFLFGQYRAKRGTLAWYCVDHWTELLGLDIALLKAEVDHLIAVHPHVPEFLELLATRGKGRVLVTNAHPRSLELKMERTRLAGHFDRVICAHDLKQPKEAEGFWDAVQAIEPFDPLRTLFVDDNLDVLRAAGAYGFHWLLAILQPDSTAPPAEITEFPAEHGFAPLVAELSLLG
ncbi:MULTISPECIES: GMP/IMP nucleotidase [Thiorhodovibrio]|uniref:GMP/IMP nucleotidase n=1 Tax=Thiorhodovibrio TaxID=61593 RepID=UPI001912460A|nr:MULTISPECIES: GMP/IMP nucleotidase [Thiorhodovibrio]MBK5970302.1 haloacid dehalogenase [Thiorhodovibrio winogradskyi]WPL13733.1 GMP/IMP nucleotidase YrfG [Thiorhodovibrio litoralis]